MGLLIFTVSSLLLPVDQIKDRLLCLDIRLALKLASIWLGWSFALIQLFDFDTLTAQLIF